MLVHRTKGRFLSSVLLVGVFGAIAAVTAAEVGEKVQEGSHSDAPKQDRVVTAVEVGEKAPDFTLPSTMGENISLSQFQGKKSILIEFYAGDFDPT
jgi:cytochrome oxidase Cu insertion factor (SCO1/SenC/PrrC family)